MAERGKHKRDPSGEHPESSARAKRLPFRAESPGDDDSGLEEIPRPGLRRLRSAQPPTGPVKMKITRRAERVMRSIFTPTLPK